MTAIASLTSLLPPGEVRDDVISIATELGSNAIKHTASGHGGTFTVELTRNSFVVRVAVSDGGGPADPRVVNDHAAEHGRGLQLVRGLADHTGVSGDRGGRVGNGRVTWDYRTFDGGRTSAEHMIGIVLDLLSPAWDDTIAVRRPALPDLTLKGLVGRALAERGMNVALSLRGADEQFFETYAEITITNPAEPGRGAVRVADHGAICWECQIHKAGENSLGRSNEEVARTIAQALTRTQPECWPA